MTDAVTPGLPAPRDGATNHAGRSRLWAFAAVAWLLFVLGVAVHQWRFWQAGRLDADVMALLPADEQAPEVALATRALADGASRQIVVMLGAPQWAQAQGAARAWREAMAQQQAPLSEVHWGAGETGLAESLAFYRPWRDRLLTPAQREQLQATPLPQLAQAALAALYQPAAQARLSEWVADPLGLAPAWWSARAGDTRARPRDGELWLAGDGVEWVVLRYDIAGSAFSLDGRAVYGEALQAAETAARAALPGVKTLRAGVPLHAEAAAVQASREINTIGWGSLAAVLLLVWLAFRSPRPIVLVGLSLLIGCAAALSITAWVFGQVHLITLVFGASLVGVAEDYGIHYFASRQGQPWAEPRSLMRQLLPGLLLALVTSVLAYLAMGAAPFPGLRQMAVFSSAGLVAAMLTVVCWFPWLDRGTVGSSRFAVSVAGSLQRWPRLTASGRAWAVYAVLAGLCAAGLLQLRPNDDVRQLQNSPPELLASQRQLSSLLGVASPAQFYLVRGAGDEELLQREEALKARLDVLVREGRLAGYSAVSDWVPSAARQRADAQLTARVESEVLARVNAALGETLARPVFAAGPLSVQRWLQHPASAGARLLWLGEIHGAQTSVVMLRGLQDAALLPVLAAAAEGLEGVRWVDKPAEVSSLLGRYRVSMSWLLLLGHAVVLAALLWRFGRAAWRAWLPTALASVGALAVLGAAGQPLQLFTVLALLLLLGVGSDYGIFLLEHEGDGSAWLAVALGAGSTWLAFGLLGLSSTPALRAFGLTLLFGLALVAVLAPMLRPAGAVDATS